ncbi:MAG: hypothetical protein ACKOEM_02550, partial [Planctomycetia bacterium]
MFVARSAARVRLARLVFLVLGFAPAAGIVAWAVHRRSDAHRAAIERRWQEAIGLPLTIGAVEHPRPGVVRGRACQLPAADGRPPIQLPLVEVESSADEDRIRVPTFRCDGAAAAVIASLAREWLGDEVRFRRTCIVEVADFTWSALPPPAADGLAPPPAALRIECVARPGTRALRLVRPHGALADEVRIVRGPPMNEPVAVAGDEGARVGSPATITVEARCESPLPLLALVVAAGGGADAADACGTALVTGTLDASLDASGWSGAARGRIEGIDLAAVAHAVGGRASGSATVDVTRLEWRAGRIADALLECAAGAGAIDGRLFDRIVLALAARPGPAARPLPPGGERSFDAAACMVAVG